MNIPPRKEEGTSIYWCSSCKILPTLKGVGVRTLPFLCLKICICLVVGKAQGQGHHQNKGTAQGSSQGGAHILVWSHPSLSEGLTKQKATASTD